MAQIRTQTLLVLDESEKEVFKDASTGKLLQNAVKPLQESLKEHAKSLAAMSKGSPNEDDLKAADAAVTELKGLLTSLPESEARKEADEQLDSAQAIIDEARGILPS